MFPVGRRASFEALLEQVGDPGHATVFPALGRDVGMEHGPLASNGVGSKLEARRHRN